MRNLKLFNTHADYESAESNLILPNVSVCKDEPTVVHYNPYVEPPETRLVAKFDVTNTSSPTKIGNLITNVDSIEIDGVIQPSVVNTYTFSTTGEHIVKYELKNTAIILSAFTGCYNMISVYIPDSVTSIGDSAFYGCSHLTSIDIPSGVTTIGERAFTNCRSLTSIDIPSGVTSISNSAFYSCYSLTSIDIPSGVTSIGNKAFYQCSGMTTCTIGSGVTSIGNEAFSCCSGLTSINIPDSVTTIGQYVFTYSNSFTTCIIGSGVTSIGDYAFYYCSSLKNVTINTTTPPTLGDGAFSQSFNRQIYVPSESVETYKSASGWSTYANFIQAIP